MFVSKSVLRQRHDRGLSNFYLKLLIAYVSCYMTKHILHVFDLLFSDLKKIIFEVHYHILYLSFRALHFFFLGSMAFILRHLSHSSVNSYTLRQAIVRSQ